MSENKRYYYMKLENNYFDLKMQKALRKQANGANMTIVYLKLQLRALSNNGLLKFEGLYPNFDEELAVDIDENLEDVRMTLAFLSKYGILTQLENNEFLLEEMQHRIGSVTDSAVRVARYREKNKALQCNANVTQLKQNCNAILDIEHAKDNNKNNINSARTRILDNIHDYYNYQVKGEHRELIDEIISTYLIFADECIKSETEDIYFSSKTYKLEDIFKAVNLLDSENICKIVNRLITQKNIHDRKHYIIATVLGIVLNK